MTTDKTPATLATAKHGGCVQLPSTAGQDAAVEAMAACLHCAESSASLEDAREQAKLLLSEALPHLSAQPSPGGQDALVDTARRNIRQFISRASFSSSVDKQAALSCVDVLEAALAARQPVDSCTESECARCHTHPDHRGEMGHAGISDFHQPVGEERPHVPPLPDAIRDVLEWYAEGPEFTAYHDDASHAKEKEALGSGDFELTSHTERGYRVYRPNGKRAELALLELDGWEKTRGAEALESFSAYAQGVEDALAGKHGATPRAQAVDLGQFRPAVITALGHSSPYGLERENLNRLLALIDSHSAGGQP